MSTSGNKWTHNVEDSTMEVLTGTSWLEHDWLYSGIPFHIPGNGGPECVNFLSVRQKYLETLIYTSLSLLLLFYSLRRIKLVTPKPVTQSSWKNIFLLFYGVVFGVEIGFKLAGNQVIWLLNPCHVISIIQLFLLALPITPWTGAIFRLHIYWITGPVLALLFPVTDSLLFNGEVKIYWIQHLLLLLAPLLLIGHGVEPSSDWTWPVLSYSVYSLFHWLVLQPISLMTEANLNNMLCPPASIPEMFGGTMYRNFAMLHQLLLVPVVGKTYPILVSWIYSKFNHDIGKLNNNKED